jgi:preprotein translocase subunit YajC
MVKIFLVLNFLLMAIVRVWAQGSSAGQRGSAGLSGMLILFLPLLLIWYFLLIKPQQKKEKERQNMLKNLQKGDKVVTIGGILGEVAQVKEDRIVLKISDKVNIEILKSAISSKISK